MYGVRDDDKIFKLTKHEYYHKAGMYGRKTKTNKWEKELEKENNDYKLFKNYSLKDDWDGYIEAYKKVYEWVWSKKLELKWAREKFRGYCLKNKVLDKFFSSMSKKKDKNLVVAYGDARFKASPKNETSAPTTSLSKRCSTHYRTVMVDEFRTTMMCNKCGKKLRDVVRKVVKDGKTVSRVIRGLKHCQSACGFLNRDKNAAYNILAVYRASLKGERPPYLCRGKTHT